MAEQPTTSAGDADLITLKIEGLIKSADNSGQTQYTEELHIKKDKDIGGLWTDLEGLGYMVPDKVKGETGSYDQYSMQLQMPVADTIEVVQDRPSEVGKYIHADEPLIAFTNRFLNENIEINVNDAGDSLKAEINEESSLGMTVHRTVRMPDDERLHQLPPSLGKFQLYNVSEYADRLPEKISKTGGVFFPMWQREATWIEFSIRGGREFALRAFVGHINAVSGEKMKVNEEQSQGEKTQTQDYVVIPGQAWLDGICVAPGVVRQFVAMPLGSGYTVEGQKTGEEKFGGLQIEVIPSYEQNIMKWIREEFAHMVTPESYYTSAYLDEYRSPSELGLVPGSKLKAFLPDILSHPVNMADLAKDISQNSQSIQAEYFHLGRYTEGASISPAAFSPMSPVFSPSSPGFSPSSPGYEASSPTMEDGGIDTFSYSMRHRVFPPPPAGPATSRKSHTKSSKRNKPSDLQAMGLAAGGKLIQDIYTDNCPAGIWNTGAARVFHVHILDPRSFEAVTHIVPRPPPKDAKGSAGEKNSYFVVEEQIDNRVDGGDFDNVASVSAMDKKKGIVTEPSLDPSRPTQCRECDTRLCDCVVRPCGHLFCNTCIKVLENNTHDNGERDWKCPTCQVEISHVAGFSAPMNLPGEETVRERVPVRVLKIEDGRVKFKSIQKTRV